MSQVVGSPSSLGPYQIVRRIAVGGMAEVFEAHRGTATQSFVLKLLLPQLRDDPDLVHMFEDEACLTSALAHENLVQVHALERAGAEYFIVMEYVEGVSLAALLKQLRQDGTLLPAPLALLITLRLLEALRYIHEYADEQGHLLEIVHRDVAPGNVLLSVRGEVKLGDFGIARHRLRTARTRTGVIKGTVQYMSPEQVIGDELDQRTDLYGVGLILFEMLTGRPFIHGEREVELIALAREPGWIAPSTVRRELDSNWDRLLQPALMRFPEERYPHARSFLAAARAMTAMTERWDVLARQEELAGLVRRLRRPPLARNAPEEPETTAPGPPDGTSVGPLPDAQQPYTKSRSTPAAKKGPPVHSRLRWWLLLVLLPLAGLGGLFLIRWPETPTPGPQTTSSSSTAAGDQALNATTEHGRSTNSHNQESSPPLTSTSGSSTDAVDARTSVKGSSRNKQIEARRSQARQRASAPAAKDQGLLEVSRGSERGRKPRADRLRPRSRSGYFVTSPKGSKQQQMRKKIVSPVAHQPRVSTAVPAPAPKEARSQIPAAEVSQPRELASLQKRLHQAHRALGARGILLDDLPPILARQMRAAQQQLERGDLQSAQKQVESLEPALAALRVDRALVEAKLQRVEQLLRGARAKKLPVQSLQDRATIALQEIMDGRFIGANKQLNLIIFTLEKKVVTTSP